MIAIYGNLIGEKNTHLIERFVKIVGVGLISSYLCVAIVLTIFKDEFAAT